MATNTYVALNTTTVTGSSVPYVEFTGISQAYTDLVLVAVPAEVSPAGGSPLLRVGNGSVSSSSIYSYTSLRGNGTSATSIRDTNLTNLPDPLTGMSTTLGQLMITYHIMNYSNTTTYKTILFRDNSNTASYPGVVATVGLWRSTSAIDTVRFYGANNIAVGSTFSLYGIAKQVQPGTAKATGGTITYDNFGRVTHTFTSTGTFTPSTTLSCDYLVVAGGGGGGGDCGGGGGAGGYLTGTGLSVSAQAYTITVGGGGSAGSAGGSSGGTGENSSFSSVTALGGGYGGGYTLAGGNGGSGGGGGTGASNNTAAGAKGLGTSGQGYDGGAGYQHSGSTNYGSGSGGGASGVGSNGNGTQDPPAGAGASNTISGSAVTYAAGGTGGGGTLSRGNGANGTANTGNGAQGGSGGAGGNGGSGIVIIRYQG